MEDKTFEGIIDRLSRGDDRNLKRSEPLQLNGQDRILREYTLGGPESNRDVRMFLSVKDLEMLLDVARHAESKRVCLPRAGVKLSVRQSLGGHQYEVLKIVSAMPVPEKLPKGVKMYDVKNAIEMQKCLTNIPNRKLIK